MSDLARTAAMGRGRHAPASAPPVTGGAAADPPREHAALLHELAAALTVAATPEQVTEAVVSTAVASFDAVGGVVALLTETGDELELVRTSAMPEDIEQSWRRFPVTQPVPLADAARTGEPAFIESREAWVTRYPGIAELLAATGHHAVMALPLVAGSRVVGAMGVSFAAARQFTAEDRAVARSAAHLCAQALERARLFDAERRARAAAEESVGQLARLYEEAQAANRAKADFLAVMSHELRTPLNAIAGYADLMEAGVPVPAAPEHMDYLRRIRANQRHLLGLIDAVLEHARAEAGHVSYAMRDVVVSDLLAEVEPLVAPQLAEKGLAYECAPCGTALLVRADPDKVRQILVNLVGNAIKFTPAGGRVLLQAHGRGGDVAIRAHDTGVGVAAAMREAIFEPFVQMDTGLTRPAQGVGLGLAISRGLARGMGGDLTVESVPGAGSTFTLSLPAASAVG